MNVRRLLIKWGWVAPKNVWECNHPNIVKEKAILHDTPCVKRYCERCGFYEEIPVIMPDEAVRHYMDDNV